ncbi:YcaO-related McrA-glycine thioamidation protein [Methanothermococcus okinawensis]|uniref:Methanogenesis marker protein 1 n=1 Tax=Methanothermococcus okinawensis (strain DSM 14208 / JCM 11175 / IH1) TaxID=647113 RepID=F8AKZ6_METOI|nr:YcaO-related McrA-glycine thioamidation protein [Methanothermococcus okinawensis]AEH06431.1 methanogenesis marker protein 1 [Methanothermococcus okinawensis IH1]
MDSIDYALETYRICSPKKTWKKIEPILDKINIVNMERIDNLDRIGIPVYSATRLTKNGDIKIHPGKGATDIQAKVSSAMESIERYSAELSKEDKEKIIKKPDNPVDLKELILSIEAFKNLNKINNNLNSIDWIKGTDIINNEIVEVPADAIFHPYSGTLFRSNTNGIASGNSTEEAIFHASFEVIERDSWSVSEISKNTYRKINVEGAKNPIIHELIEKFENANINVVLKDLTSEVGIPTVAAISDEDVLKDPALLCIGVGCHIHPEIAVIRALTEVVQSRATQIQNKRKDTIRGDIVRKIDYGRMKRIHKKWFEYRDEVDIEDMENNAKFNLKKDLNTIKEKLIDAGFDRLIVVNLKKTDVDVVRVIIPKMEVYCMDRDRISPWIRDRIKKIKNNENKEIKR